MNFVCWFDNQVIHRSKSDLDSSRANRVAVRTLLFFYYKKEEEEAKTILIFIFLKNFT